MLINSKYSYACFRGIENNVAIIYIYKTKKAAVTIYSWINFSYGKPVFWVEFLGHAVRKSLARSCFPLLHFPTITGWVTTIQGVSHRTRLAFLNT